MEIKVSDIKDIKLVRIIGSLDTNTAAEAESAINELLAQGILKIIIDLSETGYVSSAGLRIFLATAKKITASGGAVKLCSPNAVVKEVLDISGFSIILDVKETLEQAVEGM